MEHSVRDDNGALAPGLAMGSATQSAKINQHGNQQPNKIDPFRWHAAVDFPGVHDCGERQENETQHREQQSAVERALEIGGEEPHQHQAYARKQQDDEEQKTGHSMCQARIALC